MLGVGRAYLRRGALLGEGRARLSRGALGVARAHARARMRCSVWDARACGAVRCLAKGGLSAPDVLAGAGHACLRRAMRCAA